MKRAFLPVLIMALTGNLLYAGDGKPMNKAGDKALLFDLSGLANLGTGNFQGGAGAKYFVAKDLAIRLALGVQSSSSKITNPANPLPADEAGDGKFSSMNFTLAPGIQYDLMTSNSVAAYVGGQLSLTLTSQEETGSTVFNDPAPFDLREHRKDTGTTFGAGVFVGFEWFPWENISFAGEYQLGFTAGSGKREVTNAAGTTVSSDAPSTTTFGLGSTNGANLTLAVYF